MTDTMTLGILKALYRNMTDVIIHNQEYRIGITTLSVLREMI